MYCHKLSLVHAKPSKISAKLFTILFVYFAKSLPKYFVANLNSTKERFPESSVVLVSDAKIDKSISDTILIFHPDNLDWKSNRPELARDMRFWDGWWQKTFDRLLMIRPVHELFPGYPLVQVEADTVLLPSFARSNLLGEKTLAYPLYSDHQAIASIIFSSSLENSLLFEDSLIEELLANEGTSDMDALGAMARKLGDSFLELPEFPKRDSNVDGHEASMRPVLGLFDGLSHGEWICGRDPKAHWGVGRRKMRTPISENQIMPQYEIRNSQLTCTFGSLEIPIHNLHVHSKELSFFQNLNNENLKNIISKVNSHEPSVNFFQLKAFIFCLKSKMRIWSSSFFSLKAWSRLFDLGTG